ncbi:MAG: metalloregulator ArsR/SmtB family transcription factor [Acetobacterales bacterium]
MDLINAAQAMEALGNPTRLAIFRHLVVAGRSGAPVSGIQQALDIAPSTLSHHIARLMRHGLLRQERRGRTLLCTADYAAMNALVGFLSQECCARDECNSDSCVAASDIAPDDATNVKDPVR